MATRPSRSRTCSVGLPGCGSLVRRSPCHCSPVDVCDSLIAYKRDREFRLRLEERTQANREAADLATTRYQGGVTSYLEVIYNEQELFSAELNLAQARLNELLSVVSLYRSLGGGWQTPESNQARVTAKYQRQMS